MISSHTHPTEIEALVSSLDPVDWVQLELTANLPPGQRILAGLQAQAFCCGKPARDSDMFDHGSGGD